METLKHFSDFCDEILANNSRDYKVGVLKKYKDDDIVKYYLNYVFNPYVITGISKKKLSKNVYKAEEACLNVIDSLKYIAEHNTGNDETLSKISLLKDVLGNDQLCNLLDKIISKTLTLGVDVISINKCMDNYIPTFSVQLANKYFERPEHVVGKEFAITTKIDDGRIIAIKQNGDVKFYTRAGQQYEGLVDLEEEMRLYIPDNTALDGELTLLDPGDLDSKDQYKQTMKISRKDGEKHGLKMLVFDCMTAEDFMNQNCELSYNDRRGFLNTLFSEANSKKSHGALVLDSYTEECIQYHFENLLTYFELLPILYKGTDLSEISKWLDYNIENGQEGIMINICDAKYSFSRTWDLLKCKKMQSMDLEIVGAEEGSGANENKLGAFLVRYKNDNIVKVGSGFSKELREEIWRHPSDYIGQIIEVQYFEETENQNGGLSLRFPVFKDFRPEKAHADY